MQRQPYRLFSSRRQAQPDEPSRIFGLETEYVVHFKPDDPEDEFGPSFGELSSLLFDEILSARKAATSTGLKGGYFLENGGLVHLEIFLREQADTPILEMCTPECRSPWDLLVYSRAFDQLLDQVSAATRAALAQRGYRGQVVFGKNNVDARGIGFGCHENYLVRYRSTTGEQVAYLLGLPLLILLLLPIVAALISLLVIYLAVRVGLRLLPPLRHGLTRLYRWVERTPVLRQLTTLPIIISNLVIWPTVAGYSLLVRRMAFGPFLRGMTSMLVSRQILAGTGWLDFDKGVFALSQRARLTKRVASIVLMGQHKTIFDLKGLLYDPLAVFRPSKRLTLTLGDSNLSDVPTAIKLSTTALILEMVEAGESFDDLRLRSPLRALREVSSYGPWKLLALRGGGKMSALDIQRQYLERAERHFRERPDGRLRHRETLDNWRRLLTRLAERPQSLADELDWAAKKLLLDHAIRPVSDWKQFFQWGHIFHRAGLDATRFAATLPDLLARTRFWRRPGLRRSIRLLGLLPDDFRKHRDLYLQARKVDLRFHEIGTGEGYQRVLESRGLIARLSVDSDVERATREAPIDTRARVRGYYIGLSRDVHSVQANWNEVELQSPVRHISLPDPFYCRLPGEAGDSSSSYRPI